MKKFEEYVLAAEDVSFYYDLEESGIVHRIRTVLYNTRSKWYGFASSSSTSKLIK